MRADIEAGRQPAGVYFLRADSQGRVRPTGPQRVLASRLEAVLPDAQKLLLPLGFDVRDEAAGTRATNWIDGQLQTAFGNVDDAGPRFGELSAQDAETILEHIRKSLDLSGTDGWDAKGHGSLLRFLATHRDAGSTVAVCVIRGGNQSRVRGDGRFQNYFTYQRDVDSAKQHLAGRPGLLLVRQNPGAGFKPHAFWWPMILTPAGIQPHVFALS